MSLWVGIAVSFFFNDTATTEIYTLSLHDALPIYRAAAQVIVRRLAPHQGDEACELRGGLLLPCLTAGVHDQAWREIAAQQPGVRGPHPPLSPQHVHPLHRPQLFPDPQVYGRALSC